MRRRNEKRYFAIAVLLAFAVLLCCGCESPFGKLSEVFGSADDEAQMSPPISETGKATETAPTAAPTTSPTGETSHPPASALLLPQIDCSTARIPITEAIYELFTGTYGYEGPKPMCSRTHGAWLNLADGIADILFLVEPTGDELDYFAEKNIDIEMKVYGYDGLVFIGNKSNPVQNLTTRQIRDIYSGKITNWRDVGGENADIIVYIRNAESGSQRLFESLVWDGYDMPNFSAMKFKEEEIDPTVTQREAWITEYDEMDEITYSVLLNQYSIGFNIMSYIDNTFKDSTLKLFAVNGFMPITENFVTGAYPYLTTSYVVIRANEPPGSPARRLFDWVGSSESQVLISDNSTLTVSFSDSIIIVAGGRTAPEPSVSASPDNTSSTDYLSEMILRLDRQYISRSDLLPYTLEELGYLRNGIFALSGRIFSTEKYIRYFNSQDWYMGTSTSDNEVMSRFNDYQRKNLEIIIAYEKELQ
ncbi:MAG: substrate-binding domain-containing protein [Oscillospiraceae bacterium]|nr:substrate-binding domain-containing protein [Oscillospiraceae bacterium]